MTNELPPNLVPLIEYTGAQGLAAEINAAPQTWDRSRNTGPYGTFYRAAIVSPLDARLYEEIAADFDEVEPDLHASILAAALSELDDELVLEHREKVLRLTGVPDMTAENTGAEVNIRSQLDRAAVFDRLQRLGLVSGYTFNQDYFFEHVVGSENELEVTFDELLGLEGSFDSAGRSKEQLVAAFAQWADDPEGGRKILRGEGMAFQHRDLAMGFEVGRRRGEEVAEAAAIAKIDDYLATRSHELAAAYVEELLFDRSAAGLAAVDYLSAKGLRGFLFEASEQLPKAYGLALAAAGRLEEAQAVATGPRTGYEDYAYINLEIARSQRQSGNAQAAVITLDNLREVDPLLHFADRVDPDQYIGMMGGSPLGFMNESIAEEYARCRAFEKALDAYQHSRQYPEQTEPALARTAVGLEAAAEYFDAILSFEANEHDTMFMVSRLSVALMNRLNSDLGLGEVFIDKYPEIAARVPELTARLQMLRAQRDGDSLATRVIDQSLLSLFTATGKHDEALAILGRQEITSVLPMQAFGSILTDMAHRGQYERAVQLYDRFADLYKWPNEMDIPQFNIAAMGWSLVRGQRGTFDRFYNSLPEYKRSLALYAMLQRFEGQNLHIDDNLAGLIVRSEFNQGRMAESIAAIGRLALGKAAVTASHSHIIR